MSVDPFQRIPANQAEPLVGHHAVRGDQALVSAVRAQAGAQADELLASLDDLGLEAGTADTREHGMLANEHGPVLRTVDRFGHRIDEVDFHPSWHHMLTRGIAHGLGATAWTSDEPLPHLRRAAGYVAWTPLEPGHGCPMTMTYAAVPALRADDALAKEWTDGLASRTYDFGLREPHGKAGLLAGMGMTEKQGGSDVRTNVTRADRQSDGSYRLTGHKWFTSAPMNDLFLVLAQAPDGLSCFLLPRICPDGSRNPVHIVRLKDKLGNRSNASTELDFHGAYAQRLGDEGKGVRTIIEMVAATRLDCVLGSASLMRRAVAEASWHVSQRAAFGATLLDQPAMTNVIADLALDSEAATHLALRLARAVEQPHDEHEMALRRMALPLAKFWVCKRTPTVTVEAMECLGGNGYAEESGMPLLVRESPLNSIWEGSGNVNALDLLRVLAKSPDAVQAWRAEVGRAAGSHAALDTAVADVLNDLVGAARDLEAAQGQARSLTSRMAVLLQAALLVQHSTSEVADAFVASRIAGEWDGVHGTLPASADIRAIARRALPA
ncbi:acyl-CoA dehydrogenase family protein [Yimella sp. cx-51]|uniref:acyl-CoA dehydrogenase family protein n=1 Tax=Yimella sp. cx-51 TaxID=2770551 RepID=UPI00165E99F0|nr:acyl-CoA dehydrogenase family protein [Yimella sp. cx-51]MBC9956831.1 acyl-CoA dehydrogenase family protein [Yimella sp. cx-51]QTH39058.1 acyl-CoA dehydrogenase family protein [Yimella sp. cx-51]